jgi:hypothetical protein
LLDLLTRVQRRLTDLSEEQDYPIVKSPEYTPTGQVDVRDLEVAVDVEMALHVRKDNMSIEACWWNEL